MQRLKDLRRIQAQWVRVPLSEFSRWMNAQHGEVYDEARAKWVDRPNCMVFGRWLHERVRLRAAKVAADEERADQRAAEAARKAKEALASKPGPKVGTWPEPPPPLKSLPPLTLVKEYIPRRLA